MDPILAGIAAAFAPVNIAFIALGVSLGIVVGAIPGMSAPMAIAIGVPLTYAMNPVSAIAFLLGVHKGGEYGGAITSILINTPGEVSTALTALDGHPIAQQGKPRKALMLSLYSSVAGDVFADIVLIVSAAPLAVLALRMGPAELLGVLVFAFAFITTLLGRSVPKGAIALALGMLLATVGLDLETGGERLTFGLLELQDGIPLVAIAIGVLAFGEVLVQIEGYFRGGAAEPEAPRIALGSSRDDRLSWAELRGCARAILRGSVIGTGVGALPGLGASVAAFLAYGAERRASKTPEQFGKGKLEGLAAIESANNAVIGASMIPLLTLGIPGSATGALIVGAFLIHGITPGPFVFEESAEIVYGLFASLMIANLLNLVIGNVGLRVFTMFLAIPRRLIVASTAVLCLTGAYVTTGSMFGVGVTLVFAWLGYFMRKLQFPFIVFLIGFILGPMFERSLRNTAVLFDDPVTLAVEHPLLPALAALGIYLAWRGNRAKRVSDGVLARPDSESE
ncbi:MAG: tripartite tricarboxylate transporter permease [Gammaproteobacteria bacterium]|nr:tripartite tricarboxylate transporter permease [Gammaproteobacteria bacterium]